MDGCVVEREIAIILFFVMLSPNIYMLFAFAVLSLLFITYCLNENSSMFNFFNTIGFEEMIEHNIIEKKFISVVGFGGRLGNMLFRYASLYGISRDLDRIPYLYGNNTLHNQEFEKLHDIFPLLSQKMEIKIPQDSLIKVVNFSLSCCIYESPEKLKQYNEIKHLHIIGSYLQSYKYFNRYQNEVKKIFECNSELKRDAKTQSEIIWKNDELSHKLCVHVRRTDFVNNGNMQESVIEFVIPAIEYINDKLKRDLTSNISLLVFGDDQNFTKNIAFSNLNVASINVLKNSTPEYDMCFAIQYCNTMLLSASGSTFGWWAAYLKKGTGDIFYNVNITKHDHEKSRFSGDIFFPHWIKLKLLPNNTIQLL